MKKIPFFDLSLQHKKIETEINTAIFKVIDSGKFIDGSENNKFEEDFAKFCGAKYCVTTSSGTMSLILSHQALGLKNKRILVPTNTFFATASAVIWAGGNVVFGDSNRNSPNLNFGEALIKDCEAVSPVALYGIPFDCKRFDILRRTRDFRIVADLCQAVGSKYQNKSIIDFCDAGCLSFYCSKTLGIPGEGGCVLTNDRDLADEIRSLRNHGRFQNGHSHKYMGTNGRLNEILAAILNIKLKYLSEYIEKRTSLANRYYKNLSGNSKIRLIEKNDDFTISWYVFPVYVSKRDFIKSQLEKDGIFTSIHYPTPCHLQEAFLFLNHKPGDFSNAEMFCKTQLSLPFYPEMLEDDVDKVSEVLIKLVKVSSNPV